MAIGKFRRTTTTTLLAIALATAISAARADEGAANAEVTSRQHVTIGVDEARLVRLNRAPNAVIVGNPLIADVAVHENNIIIIVGKNYGTTNLIALDQTGEELTNLDLSVRTGGRNAVSLFRGTGRVSLNCSPRCEQELDVGDEFVHFEGIRKSVADKLDLSNGIAEKPQ